MEALRYIVDLKLLLFNLSEC